MPTFRITSPDGRVFNVTGPEGSTAEQALEQVKAQHSAPTANPERSMMQRTGDDIAGVVRGAGSIGATLLSPLDAAARALNNGKPITLGGYDILGHDRRAGMDAALQTLGADTESTGFKGFKLATEVAGTMGAGGALANVAARVPGVAAAAPNLLQAIRTSGMTGGNAMTRAAGGAVTGGASAGLIDPQSVGAGALIGGALPGGLQVAGKIGEVAGKGIRAAGRATVGTVSPEVAHLAKRAGELGIDIPADRLVNSKPLDAIASGLNYVPFSGRAATEAKMAEQLNRAGSRLMGQNTSNMNQALRKAGADLGAKFDDTLKSTGVAFDKQLLDDVTEVFNVAQRELGSDSLKAISSQVDELTAKGASGVIDGQAAYNIKRTLDRIGRRNTPEAWHALELKGRLMDALNRSLGPEKAQAFAKTREQYSNMLALEKLAKNGVEGEISVARLGNLKNINNEPLQELADIAAQFVKAREGQHGAMQRAVVGMGTAATAGIPGLVAGASVGRGANALLNSQTLRGSMLGTNQPNALRALLESQEAQQAILRAAPGALAGR